MPQNGMYAPPTELAQNEVLRPDPQYALQNAELRSAPAAKVHGDKEYSVGGSQPVNT